MIPHVQSAEFARRAIQRIKYPPLGHRELENVNADADFGLMPLDEYLRAANDETLVVVQIEDLEAADQADAGARRDARAGAFQQRAAGNANGEVVDNEHGRRLLAERDARGNPLAGLPGGTCRPQAPPL